MQGGINHQGGVSMKKVYVSPQMSVAYCECGQMIAASPDGSIIINSGSGGSIFDGGAVRGEWQPVFHTEPDADGWDHNHRNELF